MTIQELEQQEKELSKLLKENKERQKAYWRKTFSEEYGFGVGDTISLGDKKGVVVMVPERSYKQWVGFGELKMRLYKKDGTLGKNESNIWSSDYKNITVEKL